MPKGQRRQSQNSLLMRNILEQLREYDIDEVRLLCRKHASQEQAKPRRGRRRRKPSS